MPPYERIALTLSENNHTIYVMIAQITWYEDHPGNEGVIIHCT